MAWPEVGWLPPKSSPRDEVISVPRSPKVFSVPRGTENTFGDRGTEITSSRGEDLGGSQPTSGQAIPHSPNSDIYLMDSVFLDFESQNLRKYYRNSQVFQFPGEKKQIQMPV